MILSQACTLLCKYTFIFVSIFSIKKSRALSRGNPPRIVIVGGGVGSLATASRIAASSVDCEVIILEKNARVGGRCGSFDIETVHGVFRHEKGPSLLLLKEVYSDLFVDCSQKNTEDYGLSLKQCIPAYQVIFDDGDCIELGFPQEKSDSAADQISRLKMDEYELNGARKWDEYMRATAAFLDCGLPNFIEEKLELTTFPAFLREALRGYGKAWPLKPHSDVLDATFSSNKMKALASFQNLYVGLEPFRNENEFGGGVIRKTAPAVFGLLAAIELHPSNKNAGVFAPVGGFQAVTDAMEELALDLGVTILCETTVNKVDSEGVYYSKTEDMYEGNSFLSADIVLINADLPFATETILSKDPSQRDRYDWNDRDFDYSSGVIAFHWSLNVELTDLNTHNVFLVAETREKAEASWAVLRNQKSGGGNNLFLEPFNFYVHRASKTDPTAAPEGCDAALILVPCSTLLRNEELANMPRDEALAAYQQQFDDRLITKVREAVLRRLSDVKSLVDLEKHIIHEVVDNPATYASQYNVAAGTPFGLSHGFGQLSLTRPGAESTSHPNVLFVGASSRPGNGVPLVLIGAKLVADKVMRRLEKKQA
mmetsp:Transcript_4587/g.7119  ORF Transcript_4587/g.7119 Transcript_4587/m.7119 type:complete len:597 (+) Transcript_4587:93-1883(+)